LYSHGHDKGSGKAEGKGKEIEHVVLDSRAYGVREREQESACRRSLIISTLGEAEGYEAETEWPLTAVERKVTMRIMCVPVSWSTFVATLTFVRRN